MERSEARLLSILWGAQIPLTMLILEKHFIVLYCTVGMPATNLADWYECSLFVRKVWYGARNCGHLCMNMSMSTCRTDEHEL